MHQIARAEVLFVLETVEQTLFLLFLQGNNENNLTIRETNSFLFFLVVFKSFPFSTFFSVTDTANGKVVCREGSRLMDSGSLTLTCIMDCACPVVKIQEEHFIVVQITICKKTAFRK